MNYRIVQITPVSLTVEIDDPTPFFSEKKREVLINGKAVLETNENVFTVFDLTPNTEYTLSIDGIEVGCKTESVSCILYASSFRKENPLYLLHQRSLHTNYHKFHFHQILFDQFHS